LKKIKKIALYTFWTLLAFALVLSLGFVNQKQEQLKIKALEVNVNQEDELYFLDNDAVAQIIKDRGNGIVGQTATYVNVASIEKALNSHENIANAEVYLTIDGKLKANVTQRKPVLRIVNYDNESYYIDEDGKLMPISERYTYRTIIASGNISESYVNNYSKNIFQFVKDSALRESSILDELFAMANYINKDKFLSAQINQLYVNKDREIELVPLVGNHKIIFGDTVLMDEKFKKLVTFYEQGLVITGWWEKYSVINLKFKNQIVCLKKTDI
jgi:cell division protein FtsQ